jgi:hypothetical protein
LIVFISSPSNPLRLHDSNNSAPAQTLSAPDCALLAFWQAGRYDQAIFQSLVVAFAMVVLKKLMNGFP